MELVCSIPYPTLKKVEYVVEPHTRSVRTVQWEGRDNYSLLLCYINRKRGLEFEPAII